MSFLGNLFNRESPEEKTQIDQLTQAVLQNAVPPEALPHISADQVKQLREMVKESREAVTKGKQIEKPSAFMAALKSGLSSAATVGLGATAIYFVGAKVAPETFGFQPGEADRKMLIDQGKDPNSPDYKHDHLTRSLQKGALFAAISGGIGFISKMFDRSAIDAVFQQKQQVYMMVAQLMQGGGRQVRGGDALVQAEPQRFDPGLRGMPMPQGGGRNNHAIG